jgi:hypothetical protein
MTPAAYASHFGVAPPDISDGARLAALVVATPDLDRVDGMFEQASVESVSRMGRIIVNPDEMMGAAIVFAPA